jgi:hypothetical protein
MGQYYIDLCLPFGLKSSPALWEQFASFAEWIATHRYGITNVIHYVDDYLVGGPGDNDECKVAVDKLCKLFARLGIPINTDKFRAEGKPSTTVRFLGVCIDTKQQISYLDNERMDAIRTSLAEWSERKHCKPNELQSLIGTLSFATHVVQAGRPFLRRMIDTLSTARSLHSAALSASDSKQSRGGRNRRRAGYHNRSHRRDTIQLNTRRLTVVAHVH